MGSNLTQARDTRLLRELRRTIEAILPRMALALEHAFPGPFLFPLRECLQREWESAVPIRGFLTRVAYEMGGGRPQDIVEIATAIELCQLATLIIDDVIDRSDVRNGDSFHKAFGQGIGVVAGELLKARATNLLGSTLGVKRCFANTLRAFRHFEVMYERICLGQLLDMWYESRSPITELDYFRMIYLTTGSFLEGAATLGAMLSGISGRSMIAVAKYSGRLGLALQVYDDVFDLVPQMQDTKPFANDLKRRKQRLPLIHLLHNCSSQERRDVERILKKKMITNDDAKREVCLMKQRGSLEYALGRAQQFCRSAESIAQRRFPAPARELFVALVRFIQPA